jgi:hypothetical protein
MILLRSKALNSYTALDAHYDFIVLKLKVSDFLKRESTILATLMFLGKKKINIKLYFYE